MKRHVLVSLISLSLSAAAYADTIRAKVNGMVCGFCATGIEKTFKAQPEVKSVKVDLDKKLVTVSTKDGQTMDDAKLKKLIGNAGYSVVSVERAGK
jgi:copper chaperone CopZ